MTESATSSSVTKYVRLAGGAVVALVAALGVGFAVGFPAEQVTATSPRITANPAAGDTILGCTGPTLALGRSSLQADLVTSVAPSNYTDPGEGITKSDVTIAEVADATATMFSAPPRGAERTEFAVAGSSNPATTEVTGFSAFACQPALMQSFIAGGDTMTGASAVLTLTNPGEVTATVDITVYGVAGPANPPGSTGIVVAPGTTVAISYAALVGQDPSPVLRVDSHATGVLANLQSTIVRKLVTGGSDVQSSIRKPATTQVIPGVVVSDLGGDGPDATRVRALSVADAQQVTMAIRKVGSQTDEYSVTVDVQGGIPSDIDVPPLPAGNYVVTLTGTSDLVGAAWTTTGYGAGSDFSWSASAPELTETTDFAVPDGENASLTVVNTGSSPAEGSVVIGGSRVPLSLEAGASIAVPLAGSENGQIEITQGALAAAVSFSGTNAIASFPIWPGDAAFEPVTVSR